MHSVDPHDTRNAWERSTSQEGSYIEKALGLIQLLFLAIGCSLLLETFLTAILLAAILCVSTSWLFRRIDGLQADQYGRGANWMVQGKMVPGMGGAMDLATGAKRVIVAMRHTAKARPEIVRECSLPLTSDRIVDLVVAELAVIGFPEGRAILLETAEDVTVEQVTAATEADLAIPVAGNETGHARINVEIISASSMGENV